METVSEARQMTGFSLPGVGYSQKGENNPTHASSLSTMTTSFSIHLLAFTTKKKIMIGEPCTLIHTPATQLYNEWKIENFVSFPTHLSGHTLDLILVPAGSEYVKHVEALPIDSDMSDHALILFILEVMRPHAVRIRSYRNVDTNSIVNDIQHILNVLDVSSLTAEDCTIWYSNF